MGLDEDECSGEDEEGDDVEDVGGDGHEVAFVFTVTLHFLGVMLEVFVYRYARVPVEKKRRGTHVTRGRAAAGDADGGD